MCGTANTILLVDCTEISHTKAINWILGTPLTISQFVQKGIESNERFGKISYHKDQMFTLSSIHLFSGWERLTNNPVYARQIVVESKKLDYDLLCSDFKIVLQACYDTLSKVDLFGNTDTHESLLETQSNDRELVTV